MNLETALIDPHWDAVRNSYQNRNFSGAVLDSIYFMTDLLREKADLEGDGVALVGKALGGNDPRVKITPLRSETDWNVQRGVEQLLRGVYQAIRNPRSHERVADTEGDALAIILFIDYLVRLLGQSRSPFSKTEYLGRVFDPNFVKSDRYAKLLIDEIPAKKRLEVFYEVYEGKEEGDAESLRHFFEALLEVLDAEEKEEVHRAISQEFKQTDSDDAVRTVIRAFPQDLWDDLEEAARLRIENKLLRSVSEGAYLAKKDRCRAGALGTWTTNVLPQFTMKKELASILLRKLESDDFEQQGYVFKYFLPRVFPFFEWPNDRLERVLVQGLEKGDIRFKETIESLAFLEPSWGNEVRQALGEFVEVEPAAVWLDDDDDLPF